MPDPRFFRRAGPFSLGEIARRVGAEIAPRADAHSNVTDVGTIDGAGASELTAFYDRRYVTTFTATTAGACITTEAFAAHAPAGCAVLIAKDPRAAFAAAARLFYPDDAPPVALDPVFGPGVEIGAGAVVETGAAIGEGTHIGANAVIGAGVQIGAHGRVGPNVTLSHCLIGDRAIIHPGVQIGQDGFGFVPTSKGLVKIPQLGRVIIGNDVEIGANTCIDRGASGDTVIGAGTKIDNLVQIAHNVLIGENCVIVAQTGIAGSCRIGCGVLIGGQTAVSDHVNVGDGAQIAGKSGLTRDVAPGETVMGYPAKPIRQFWREIAALSRLTRRDK